MKNIASPEERVWAVLAHLSALALGMGLILPVLGWAEQRRKSKSAAFQSLQALGYQSLGFTVWLLAYLIIMILLVILLFFLLDSTMYDTGVLLFSFWFYFVIFVNVGAFGVYMIFPVVAAISCALGKDFRYPFIGKRLAKYLAYDLESESWLNGEHEDRWVAAMGHFSVIIALWGLLAPLTAWILQGKRSLWLKFQSVQAIVFHALVLVLVFFASMLYIVGYFVNIILTRFSATSAMSSSDQLIGIVVMFGLLLIALLIFLIVPLFHIIGQWAGYRVLKGDDYQYPLIGKFVKNQIDKRATAAPATTDDSK